MAGIEVGCTVLDRGDKAWRVLRINEPQHVEIDGLGIDVVTVKVTDGIEVTTKQLGELDRAEMMAIGQILARGFR